MNIVAGSHGIIHYTDGIEVGINVPLVIPACGRALDANTSMVTTDPVTCKRCIRRLNGRREIETSHGWVRWKDSNK